MVFEGNSLVIGRGFLEHGYLFDSPSPSNSKNMVTFLVSKTSSQLSEVNL